LLRFGESHLAHRLQRLADGPDRAEHQRVVADRLTRQLHRRAIDALHQLFGRAELIQQAVGGGQLAAALRQVQQADAVRKVGVRLDEPCTRFVVFAVQGAYHFGVRQVRQLIRLRNAAQGEHRAHRAVGNQRALRQPLPKRFTGHSNRIVPVCASMSAFGRLRSLYDSECIPSEV
jgi:hypothetical protein